MSQRTYWVFAAVGLLVPLLAWWALASAGLVSKVFMPGPADVWARVLKWSVEDNLLGDTFISVYRVTTGWALSAVIALPLGLLIGSFRPVQALLEPLTDFIRYMPAVAFIPLVMLWVGIDESSKISIIFIGTFFQMVLMVAEDVRRVWARMGGRCSSWYCCNRPSRHCSTRCASPWDGPGLIWSSRKS